MQCSCGYLASGTTAEELLADVEAHIEAAHGQMPTRKAAASTYEPIASVIEERKEDQ